MGYRPPVLLAILASSAAAAPAWGQDRLPVKSGLQPGDTAPTFHVQDVTGPHNGEKICYACAFGTNGVINIQTRRFSEPLIELIRRLDGLVSRADAIRDDSRHAFVVYLTDDPDAATRELEAITQKHGIKNVPLTIYDELTGPRDYKIAADAEVTVMMWDKAYVTVNHAAAAGECNEAWVQRILQDARKHVQK